MFGRQGALWGVPFDLDRLVTTGPEEVLLQGIEVNEQSGGMALAVSREGALVYVSGAAVGIGSLAPSFVWVDQDGGEELVPLPPRLYSQPRLSPDGSKLAVRVQDAVMDESEQLLWVYDIATGAALRLTNEALTFAPVWTPDSRNIVFGWNVGGETFELYSAAADGSRRPEALSPSDIGPAGDFPTSITPDGTTLIFSRQFAPSHIEVWQIGLADGETPRPVLGGAFIRGNAEVSPDGDWLAYRSNQSGQYEVYVQPYPGPGPTLPVSIGGGHGPVWSVDGSGLYYRRDGDVMVVEVNTAGGAIEIGTPREHIQGSYFTAAAGGTREYHVGQDGRLLMLTQNPPTGEIPGGYLTLVENWFEELKDRVPVD